MDAPRRRDQVTWLPVLYTHDNQGKVRVFKAGYSDGVFHSGTGLVYKKDGTPGVVTPRAKKIPQKTNTSSTLEAAKLYATQKWEKKVREGYKQYTRVPRNRTPEEQESLAGRWPAVSKNWKDCDADELVCTPYEPWYAQAKVNGDRLMAWDESGEIKLYSRKKKEKNFMEKIRENCLEIFDYIEDTWPKLGNVGLDGEVFSPTMRHHQQSRSITSRSKNRHPDEDLLVFFIFDIMEYTLPFTERFKIVDRISEHFNGTLSNVAFLGTTTIVDPEGIPPFVQACADEGFDEGIVLRRGYLLYDKKKEHKHCDMVKLKKEEDAEYEVIGYKEGSGDREGCVVWHLQDPDNPDIKFWSAQIGTVEVQREYYDHAEEYIGRLATVKFATKSMDGVPIFPDVTHFRDEEDLPER